MIDRTSLAAATSMTTSERRAQFAALAVASPAAWADAVRDALAAPYLASVARMPFAPQEAFCADPARDLAVFAGVRSGKTFAGAEVAGRRIVEAVVLGILDGIRWSPVGDRPMVGRDRPRRLFWLVAPTYRLARTAWAILRSVLRRVELLVEHEIDGAIWLTTGVLIERRTGSDERQLQADRVDGAWVDEVCSLPFDSWLQIRNRLTDAGGWVIGTGSPRPGTWARAALWDVRDSAKMSVHHWTTEDNPHISRPLIEEARAMLPERWFRRDFLADWSTYDGLVYDAYGDAAIVDDPDLCGVEIHAAVDFGRRRPAALLIAALADCDVVVDEIVMADVLEETFFMALADLCRRRGLVLADVWCDPAGQARNAQTGLASVDVMEFILRQDGLISGSARWPRGQVETSIANGVGVVASRFLSAAGERRLFVARSLTEPTRTGGYPRGVPGIHGSLLGYVYPDLKRGGRGAEDVPVKDGIHDHFCDALRMYVVGRHGVGIGTDVGAMTAAATVDWGVQSDWDGGW